jgi:uroporphyrin-III C-methyltransferase
MGKRYFPMFLDLNGRACVVVGGGTIATPKIRGLLDAGGEVTVVAPDISADVAQWERAGRICRHNRRYQPGDCDGAFLVIAATDEAGINRTVYDDGHAAGCLVNVVDTKPLCDWITPSTIERDDLTIAISTNGTAPALAATIRRWLEQIIDHQWSAFLTQARLWRKRVTQGSPGYEIKKTIWYGLVDQAARGQIHANRAVPQRQTANRLLRMAHPAVPIIPQDQRSSLGVVGIDHTHAPLDLLERVTVALSQAQNNGQDPTGIARLRDVISGLVVLSTCHRVEFYFDSERHHQARKQLEGLIAKLAGRPLKAIKDQIYHRRGIALAQHVFSVAAGLQSVVPLENEIQGQVRRAFNRARRAGTLTPSLCRLFQAALLTGKKVRRSLDAVPRRSIAHRAVAFIRNHTADLTQHVICLYGNGAFGQVLRRALVDGGVDTARIVSIAHPGELDSAVGSGEGDVVLFTCQRVNSPVIGAAQVRQIVEGARRRLLIMDLGMPRNADPAVSDLYGVQLWNLDDLTPATVPGSGVCADVQAAREIVASSVQKFTEADDGLSRTTLAPTRSHGTVYIVGAGPGDPGLITVRGREALARADVILTDRLVGRELLSCAPAPCEIIDVGKSPGQPCLPQTRINEMLIEQARRGRTVVRLKGGDPFVFGRGSEEAAALHSAGIDCVLVPGISSAVAVPASVGIPVTHRGVARSFAVVTAHDHTGTDANFARIGELARTADTLVVLMGMSQLAGICEHLTDVHGMGGVPAAVIQRGTTPQAEHVTGSVGNIAARAAHAKLASPAVIVIGETVRHIPLENLRGWIDAPQVATPVPEVHGLRGPARPLGRRIGSRIR